MYINSYKSCVCWTEIDHPWKKRENKNDYRIIWISPVYMNTSRACAHVWKRETSPKENGRVFIFLYTLINGQNFIHTLMRENKKKVIPDNRMVPIIYIDYIDLSIAKRPIPMNVLRWTHCVSYRLFTSFFFLFTTACSWIIARLVFYVTFLFL